MPDQPRGLYELLITEALHARLDGLDDRWEAATEPLCAADAPDRIALFLGEAGLEIEDVYAGNRSWSDLLEAAEVSTRPPGPRPRRGQVGIDRRSLSGILASGFFTLILRTRKDRYGLPLVTTGQLVKGLLARVADRIGVAYPSPSCSL